MRRMLTADELSNSHQKLARLESLYASQDGQTGGDVELRAISLDSLGRLITQLKEEILWSESHSQTQRQREPIDKMKWQVKMNAPPYLSMRNHTTTFKMQSGPSRNDDGNSLWQLRHDGLLGKL